MSSRSNRSKRSIRMAPIAFALVWVLAPASALAKDEGLMSDPSELNAME